MVDGYNSACGSYTISVTENGPCDLTWPPGAFPEGEPDCYDGYYDSYDGGCNGSGWIYTCPDSQTFWGNSGTYLYQGLSYRDTDWYSTWGTGSTMTETCVAEFPLLLVFIYGTSCADPRYDYTVAHACQTVSLSHTVAAGVEAWMWVGPSQFNGIPCGSHYVLSLSGLGPGYPCGGEATEPTTWGAVKSLYR